MFVTYPQSGNGQRQVMSDHRRNMFLSFHLVVVSRDPRARGLSLSLSLKPSARETICCFVPMVAFLLAVLEQRDQASGGSSEWCYGLDVVCR